MNIDLHPSVCLVLWNAIGSLVSQCIPQVQDLRSEVTKNSLLNIKISPFFKFRDNCQAIQRLNLVPVAVLPLPRKAGLAEFISICRFHANTRFPFSNTQVVLLLFGSQACVPEQKKNALPFMLPQPNKADHWPDWLWSTDWGKVVSNKSKISVSRLVTKKASNVITGLKITWEKREERLRKKDDFFVFQIGSVDMREAKIKRKPTWFQEFLLKNM